MTNYSPDARLSKPSISICQSLGRSTLPSLTSSIHNTESNVSSEGKWLRAGSIQNMHSPKQHIFSNSILRRQMSSNDETRKALPLLAASLKDGSSENESTAVTDGLLSSPAPPIETGRWSSVFGGDQASEDHTSDTFHSSQPTTPQAQHSSYVTRQGIDDVVSNIRAYLFARRHSDCTGRTGGKTGKGNRPSPFKHGPFCDAGIAPDAPPVAPDRYLVSTNDIANILDIVIAGLREPQPHVCRSYSHSDVLSSDSESMPMLAGERIVPGTSSLADPAVTVSSAQPCFTDSFYSPFVESSSKTPKITYVSRRSTTEVN
ncbi:hypothetical protein F5Y18DRAFT_277361 [Xylariaceae sp. FL1019]|nr:hypothetical protein F5Y18DRAFT_277361 [Xylariaceae sp. FL1019]